MLGRYDLPEHNQLIQLNASGSNQQPTLMYIPSGVNRIERLWYYNTNPSAGLQVSQFGAYSHGVNVDIPNTPAFITTSTSTVTMALGPATFVTATSGLPIGVNEVLLITSGVNSMVGTVISYVGTNLQVNISSLVGSGTYSSWTIQPNPTATVGPGYQEVWLMTPEDFIIYTQEFNPLESTTGTMTIADPESATGSPANFTFYYKNNIQPQYYCVISNNFVVFDSYDNTQDSTLQSSKSLAYGWVIPAWQMVDSFIPPLDDQQFPMLLNEAKSLAFLELKQREHPKAEREVLRQLASLQKFKFRANRPEPIDELPNFGRRVGRGGYAIYRR
jgi:hypothetical protein